MRHRRSIINIAMVLLKYLPSGHLNDRLIILLQFYRTFRRFPDLKNPRSYSEKLQRRKLYDRNPELVTLLDKYLVRDYVAKRIGKNHLVPLLQVCESPEDIDFDTLPDRFVLKPNHSCNLNLIVHDKNSLDIRQVKKKARAWLKSNHYQRTREWAYREIHPLLMVEALIDDGRGGGCPADFKVVCFDGKPRYLVVFTDRYTSEYKAQRYIVEDGKIQPAKLKVLKGKSGTVPLNTTDPLISEAETEELLRLASVLSRGNDHMRVDFYHVDGQFLFGEMTLYYGSGLIRYEPKSFDEWLGSWWQQPY